MTTLLAPSNHGSTVLPVSGTTSVGERSDQATADPVFRPMRFLTRLLAAKTTAHIEFVDVTEQVAQCVTAAGVHEGHATVFSRHTTACIRINEHEPLLLQDMVAQLERLIPQDAAYRHDDLSVRTVNLTENERVNGHSHCRSLLLGASETIPVFGGQLLLGRWQRIFFVELDGPSEREFVVQVMGH